MLISISLLSAALLVAPLQDAPLEGGKDVPVPKRVSGKDPVISKIARNARIDGILAYEITVNPQGKVTGIRVVRNNPILDRDGIEAVKTWSYEPTVVNEVPRAVRFIELIDMFAADGDAIKYYEKEIDDRTSKSEWRSLCIRRLARFEPKNRKDVVKALTRYSTSSEAELASAAKETLASLPEEKK